MIPDDDDGQLATFYECQDCQFLFSDIKDKATDFYEFEFSGGTYQPEPGSEIQYMRLLQLAADLIDRPLHKCDILDFGCADGHFLKTARRHLDLLIFGLDPMRQATAEPFIFSTPPNLRFDIVVSREVVEHLTSPREAFLSMKQLLKPGGAIVFQTALYQPGVNDRSWGYIGPKNGHVSLYSSRALDRLAEMVGASRRSLWNGYLGIQAWQPAEEAAEPATPRTDLVAIKAADLHYTALGTRDGAAITEARADAVGNLIYGPYCEVPPGCYRAVLLGRIEGRYRVRFCAGRGAITLGVGVVNERSATVDIEITRPCHDFECIIKRRPDSGRIWLEGIALHRIERRPNAPPPHLHNIACTGWRWIRHLWPSRT
jgi:2-polyprenyl-6-hydroxyphenyl methylase/3-demethylubiquinone-9 3-methyltransferase